jgi:hypothetical protein
MALSAGMNCGSSPDGVGDGDALVETDAVADGVSLGRLDDEGLGDAVGAVAAAGPQLASSNPARRTSGVSCRA